MKKGTVITHRSSRPAHALGATAIVWLCLWTGSAFAAAKPETALPNDAQIEHEVSDRLLMDHGVQGNEIDVDSVSGIVTLSGTTANLLAKRRAARIAATMKGVRSVINRIEVEPVMRLDRHIHADVRLALFENVRTEGYQIDMEVDEGVVALTGTVDSFRERQLVEQVASAVKGVVDVENRIGVRVGDRSDEEIAEDIRGALHWDRYIDAGSIDVSVENARVTLEGKVGSFAERQRAVTDAWVVGTKAVDATALGVEPAQADPGQREPGQSSQSDDAIAQAISDALLFDPRVISDNVFVGVEDGVVTLRGKVDLLAAKQAAAQVARDTVGVSRVRNYLRVRTEVQWEDTQAARRIERIWEWNPYLSHFDLSAEVVDGRATLEGTVSNYFEKAKAEMLAYTVEGVVLVSNHITVIQQADPLAYNPYIDDWYPYDYDWFRFRTETTKSDEAIRQDIQREFWWSPFVDADQILVEVNDGVATLSGSVDTPTERQRATENALEGGALKVVNKLRVLSAASN